MKALILSGGSGTRLRPLTHSMAKQLVPVANKPILHHLLDKIQASGIKETALITGDTSEEVRKSIGSGSKWDMEITYIQQEKPLGLGHAVKISEEYISGSPFIMLLGDNLFSMSLDPIVENFESENLDASILLYRVENPQDYGVAVIKEGRILKLVEKPKEFISDLIITGVYLFNSKIFDALRITPLSSRGELEITDAIQNLLEMGGSIGYTLTQGWWKDTGKKNDVLEANRLTLKDMCNGVPEGLFIRKGDSTAISASELFGPCIIGENCKIQGCKIGPNVTIGNNCIITGLTLSNSIVMDNCSINGSSFTNMHNSFICTGSKLLIPKNNNIEIFVGPDTIWGI